MIISYLLFVFVIYGDLRELHVLTHFFPTLRSSDLGRDIVDQGADEVAARHAELASDEIGGLDAVGALINRRDARVAIMLRGAGFLDEAHAPMHLPAEARAFAAAVGRVRLDQRDQYVGAHPRGLVAQFAEVDLRPGQRSTPPPGLRPP